MGKQETTEPLATVGAPSTWMSDWTAIDWTIIYHKVNRLQMRIAKAAREERWGKVKSLQRILTRSMAAKLWATRRVVTNRGRHTPGVDGVLWKTPKQKIQGARSLRRRGYRPQALRRIYIPKKSGKKMRPLSIPTMKDRAMQALYLLSLLPVAETLADPSSFGFRPKRSTADAHVRCYGVLAKRSSPEWIFDADIESCFDRISHDWLLANIPMDKAILRSWLRAGYLEKDVFFYTREGTPQGGIISPTLANMTLDGLEGVAQRSVAERTRHGRSKVHVIRYCDDFVVTARSREDLVTRVIPAIERFLAERGLRISSEKSKIVHISAGFDFLGANVRKYNGKFLAKPMRESTLRVARDCRDIVKKHRAAKTEVMIQSLNARLRGWGHYYRHLVASKAFGYLDFRIFADLKRWMKRRHPKKSITWCCRKYFRTEGHDRWVFSAEFQTPEGTSQRVDLMKLGRLGLRRHIQVRTAANPFDPAYGAYFHRRQRSKSRAVGAGWSPWHEVQSAENVETTDNNRAAGSDLPAFEGA
jgi:RNA-directed DNA polymerase